MIEGQIVRHGLWPGRPERAISRQFLRAGQDAVEERDTRRPRRGGRAAAEIGHLNQLNLLVADLQVAAPANAREMCGIGAAQHLAAGLILLDAQAQAQPDVVAHLVGHPDGPLRGKQQVHAQRAAQPGDAFQLSLEFLVGRDHLGILVDDDHQVRQGLLCVARTLAVGHDVGRAEDSLPALQFSAHGGEHAVDGRRLEIGEDLNAVRKLEQGREGPAALVVDQDEVQHARIVGEGKLHDQGDEQRRLAGAGAAGNQAVHAVHVRFEAQRPHPVAGRHADGCFEPINRFRRAAACPARLHELAHIPFPILRKPPPKVLLKEAVEGEDFRQRADGEGLGVLESLRLDVGVKGAAQPRHRIAVVRSSHLGNLHAERLIADPCVAPTGHVVYLQHAAAHDFAVQSRIDLLQREALGADVPQLPRKLSRLRCREGEVNAVGERGSQQCDKAVLQTVDRIAGFTKLLLELHVVVQENDNGRLCVGRMLRIVFVDGGHAGAVDEHLAPVNLFAHIAHQLPDLLFISFFIGRDHRTDMRKVAQRAEAPATEVEEVHVQVSRRVDGGE